MPRVKRGVTARARHKKVFKQTKGFRGRRKNVYRVAKQALMKAGQYAYRDRRTKKREFRALWDEFEEKKTAESKFATAVDRFQPMLLNCRTQGAAWNRHGVTHDRVVARNQHIADGCAPLWVYAERMLRETMEAGHLAAGPKL